MASKNKPITIDPILLAIHNIRCLVESWNELSQAQQLSNAQSCLQAVAAAWQEPASGQQAFEDAAKPLIRYLCDNHHPHVVVVVDSTRAQALEGLLNFNTTAFVRV